MHDTLPRLEAIPFPAIRRARLTTLQVNLGYRCNQSCLHCHVNAGPNRTEAMAPAMIDLVPQVLDRRRIATLDITGGAPELHPEFRRLVAAARDLGVKVMDRCNLTILSEPGQEDTAAFLAENEVEVVASMPCYLADNVDRQRGNGVFDRSIGGLRRSPARARAEPRVQSAGAEPAARPESARGRLQAGAPRRARHRLRRALRPRQHADPALRLNADLQGAVRRLHGAVAWRPSAGEPPRGHVPQPRQRRFRGLPARL